MDLPMHIEQPSLRLPSADPLFGELSSSGGLRRRAAVHRSHGALGLPDRAGPMEDRDLGPLGFLAKPPKPGNLEERTSCRCGTKPLNRPSANRGSLEARTCQDRDFERCFYCGEKKHLLIRPKPGSSIGSSRCPFSLKSIAHLEKLVSETNQ